ncbi:type VI secretion system baseplate subunit TssK [Pseudomonas viridiflava]|uniref:Type VI secretion protein n=1 Tax=Pseudomonas viridiflava TaxID=33069 RepID=A0A3M5P2N2_PSEVI|nr:type VI secretion system baseplate subunit TssK [Pseudomonas viridiflava]RMT78515.1 hypothetical protein ALP40_01986 [Pseudomonas viridiflava]
MNSHKVIWHEGMLLRPQHFQHNDRYYNDQMRLRTQLAGTYIWGFTKIEIDRQFLGSGQVVVNQAAGILPDGTVFDLGDRDRPLVLDIPPNTAHSAVYLALPLVAGNCIETRSPEQPDVIARFTSYTATVADSNAGENASTEILCARPEFQLLFGEPGNDHAYVKLKVCHVLVSTPDKTVSLDAEFVPSFINVGGSAYLMSYLKETVSLLEHRGDAIAARIRSSGQGGTAEVGDFMMLQLINRTQLVFQHYLTTRSVHPETLYCALLALLGELATFGTQSKRPLLDGQYQHSDQGATFGKVMHAIRQVLSMVLEQHATELALQKRQYGVLVSPRVDPQMLGSVFFVLAASAQCEAEELRHRLPSNLKVGSVESIRELVTLHLPGIRIRPLPVAPRQIPFHSKKTYFILELNDNEQAQVATSGGFAFHVSGEFSGLELQFWAIRN